MSEATALLASKSTLSCAIASVSDTTCTVGSGAQPPLPSDNRQTPFARSGRVLGSHKMYALPLVVPLQAVVRISVVF